MLCFPPFKARFSQMKASGDYFVTVVEDTRKNEIIGAASLIIERKFIHNCAVVSTNTHMCNNYSKIILNTLFTAWPLRRCGCQ